MFSKRDRTLVSTTFDLISSNSSVHWLLYYRFFSYSRIVLIRILDRSVIVSFSSGIAIERPFRSDSLGKLQVSHSRAVSSPSSSRCGLYPFPLRSSIRPPYPILGGLVQTRHLVLLAISSVSSFGSLVGSLKLLLTSRRYVMLIIHAWNSNIRC